MNAGLFREQSGAFARLAHRSAGARFRIAHLARGAAGVVLGSLELLELERELFDRRGDAGVFAGDFDFDLWSWSGSHFSPADHNFRSPQNARGIRWFYFCSAGRESRPHEKIDLIRLSRRVLHPFHVRDEKISKSPRHDVIEARGVVLRELPNY